MTQAAMARPEEEAVLGRPRQAAFLTATAQPGAATYAAATPHWCSPAPPRREQ